MSFPEHQTRAQRPRQSVERRVRLVFLIFALLCGASVALPLVYAVVKQQRLASELYLESRVLAGAKEIDAYFQDLVRKPGYIARIPGVLALPLESLHGLIEGLSNHNDAYECIVVADETGRVLQDACRRCHVVPESVAHRPVFQQVIRSHAEFISPITKTERGSFVDAAWPLRNAEGRVGGVLIARINLRFLKHILGSLQIGVDGIAYVVDHENNLLLPMDSPYEAHAQRHAHLIMPSDENESLRHMDAHAGISGDAIVDASVALGETGWILIAELPAREVNAPLYQMLAGVALVALAMLAVAACLGLWVASWISKPLTKLIGAVEDLAAGKHASRAPTEGGDEFSVLGVAFNSMAEAIRERTEALQLSELRWQFALEGAGDGVWDWDIPTGRVFFSRQWKAMLGFAEDEIGAHIEEWRSRIHTDDVKKALDAHKFHFKGDSPAYKTEFRMRCKDGGYKWILARGKVIERGLDGAPLRAIGTHTDITDRKRTELNLTRAMESAQAANRAKSEFLATMSHELRTPLNAVIGYADLLVMTQLQTDQREYVQLIQQGGTALLDVISNILDFSRIESGRLELNPQPFGVRPCAEEVVRLMEGQARAKGLDLRLNVEQDVPAYVTGDSVRVRQILLNLLGNAIKFTQRGHVDLSVSASTYQPEAGLGRAEVRFAVHDTGIGIEEKDFPKIFQPFVQVDQGYTRRFGGTGLGLAICSRLARAMNGRIDVESLPKRGSTFTFSAPFELGDPASLGVTPARPEGARATRVLLIDDDPEARSVLGAMLRRFGHEVRLADNGNQALAWLGDATFDVLISEVQRPEPDGLANVRAIRESEGARGRSIRLPIIGLVDETCSPDFASECIGAGVDCVIRKPVHVDELFEALKTVLRESSSPTTLAGSLETFHP